MQKYKTTQVKNEKINIAAHRSFDGDLKRVTHHVHRDDGLGRQLFHLQVAHILGKRLA